MFVLCFSLVILPSMTCWYCPRVPFGSIKTADQLYLRSLHRVRERWVMRRTADELVTYSVDCLKAHRVVRFFLQLLAQAQHVCIDGARGGIVVVTPCLAEQLGAGDDPILVVQEEAQHLELL